MEAPIRSRPRRTFHTHLQEEIVHALMFGLGLLPILLIVLLLIPAMIALFQWLWNSTMPQVFRLNTITFWQALRLLVIAAFLFGVGHGFHGD
jgi:hypothetical protein